MLTTCGSLVFDKVIFACHADEALESILEPTATERELLSPFHYQKNHVVLHTDDAVMPAKRSAWSAWNYRVQKVNGKLAATTIYDMNKLQQVSDDRNYFISLNDPGIVARDKVLKEIEYEHPIFTSETQMAQQRLQELNANGTRFFCGSYFGFGFHEDALRSAVQVCYYLLNGNPWEKSEDTVQNNQSLKNLVSI